MYFSVHQLPGLRDLPGEERVRVVREINRKDKRIMIGPVVLAGSIGGIIPLTRIIADKWFPGGGILAMALVGGLIGAVVGCLVQIVLVNTVWKGAVKRHLDNESHARV